MSITFTDGTNTDIVEVRCSTVPYPVFLQATITDIFKLNKIRYGINNVTGNNKDQFNQRVLFIRKSLFGAAKQNPIDLSSFNSPEYFKDNVIDVSVTENIDKECIMVVEVIQTAVANFTVSTSLFIEAYDKHNAQSENV
jgi:hypothetical protein